MRLCIIYVVCGVYLCRINAVLLNAWLWPKRTSAHICFDKIYRSLTYAVRFFSLSIFPRWWKHLKHFFYSYILLLLPFFNASSETKRDFNHSISMKKKTSQIHIQINCSGGCCCSKKTKNECIHINMQVRCIYLRNSIYSKNLLLYNGLMYLVAGSLI